MDDSQDSTWWTKQNETLLKSQFPLHSAVRDGDMEIIASLLKTGRCDLYQEDGFYGWTPVHWAAHYGKLDCLMQLLQHGASCDASTLRFNQTPAHIASLSGKLYCLKWLLNCGASLNRQDYLGETPLHKAARTGSSECANLLVAQGAALGLRNHSGHTPGQVASLGGFTQCALNLEKSLQFQERSMAANIVSYCNNNNNNNVPIGTQLTGPSGDLVPQIKGSAQQNGSILHQDGSISHQDGSISHQNGSIVHQRGSIIHENGDAEMVCDMDTACADEHLHEPHGYEVMNGFHIPPVKAMAGNKRGLDDVEVELTKRRRYEGQTFIRETPENNNVLSSYHSILALSANPKSFPSEESVYSADALPHSNASKASVMSAVPSSLQTSSNVHVSNSVLEHSSSMAMEHGYDSLLAHSLADRR